MILRYAEGLGDDPYRNLALEELLLHGVRPGECVLYLWQNRQTVVIGRNQNAWRECRVAALEADGGKLARRLSGGGAVFHDLGNLNFTFLTRREDYDVKRQLDVVLRAVKSFGVRAEPSGRNDLVAGDGRKFSGNAFHLTPEGCCHHGTLMLDVDLERLTGYLNVPAGKLAGKGVASVRSRVVNLRALAPEITVPLMRERMAEAFGEVYGGVPDRLELSEADAAALAALEEKYASFEWRLGESKPFEIAFERRFDWGGVEIQLAVKGGMTAGCRVYSDAMDAPLIERAAERLRGVRCSSAALADALAGDAPALADIRNLILEQEL